MTVLTEDTIQMELPATYKYLSVLSTAIEDVLSKVDGLTELHQMIYNMQLAVQEACTNIVDHAYEGKPGYTFTVKIVVQQHPQTLTISLIDKGVSFDISQRPEVDLDTPSDDGGYGLFLMHQLLDEVRYEVTNEGNLWVLVKRLC